MNAHDVYDVLVVATSMRKNYEVEGMNESLKDTTWSWQAILASRSSFEYSRHRSHYRKL